MENQTKQEQKHSNDGFTLVELIVVIAIMAILIGIMVPNMISYIERTNVSADIQYADTIRTAVKTAMMDPAVLGNDAAQEHVKAFQGKTTGVKLEELVNEAHGGGATAFGKSIATILGEEEASDITADWVVNHLRSKAHTAGTAMTITVQYVNNDIQVIITNSDVGDGTNIQVP